MPVLRRRASMALAILTLCAATWLGLAGPSLGQEQATPAPSGSVRDVLVSGLPDAAPGQELQLARYTIQPGTTLAVHTHPGMQIAWIAQGVLTYTVVEGGEIPIWRAASEGSPEPAEMLGPGEQTELHPGDSVVETEGVVHFGANLGDEVVIILASTLLTEGMPPATIVDIGTPVPSS